jgi:YVTN family beta-propeller protein
VNALCRFKLALLAGTLAGVDCAVAVSTAAPIDPVPIPTGQTITPTAAPGATFQELNPGLASLSNFTAGQAVTSVISPDGKTLLVLTSGYNQNYDANGATIAAQSNEYVFVFDITSGAPRQTQVLTVPNTYVGLAFAPAGDTFYVSGGTDDNVHVFKRSSGAWAESGAPIALKNGAGNGIDKGIPALGIAPFVGPEAAAVAVSADGRTLAVANYENDSISLLDVASGSVKALDLRPGKIDPSKAGVPGGEFPYWVAFKGSDTVYVSSLRDRQIVVVTLTGDTPKVSSRIALKGNPTKMILNKAQTRLLVASDNSDTVDIIDTASQELVGSIDTTSPGEAPRVRRGSSPNSLALSPDEETLYVTNAGTNALAVIELDDDRTGGEVTGLIPTGWYPNSVTVSADGATLYVVNGKSNAGPNPQQCTAVGAGPLEAAGCPASLQNGSANQYVWQLTKAGLLTLPVPRRASLARLTETVAANNGFELELTPEERAIVRGLRERIKHVIYIVKENRTYDQVLGDLPQGNGDASIAQFPQSITPNFHAIASNFVLLDNFYCSGEVSMDGWQWSTAARSVDANDKSTPVNYAGRGLSYDSEGTSRDINVAFPDNPSRAAALSGGAAVAGEPPLPLAIQALSGAPLSSLADPDALPGTANEVGLDGPAGEPGAGYIWNAALRAGKSVRNYGFFLDLTLESVPSAIGGIPPIRDPFSAHVAVAVPAHPDLIGVTDPYFRGFDNVFPDFYRVQEWSREFDQFVAGNNLPQLELVRVMHDHMGNFDTAIDGVNTPETQQADNDYAVGLIAQKVAGSPYAKDTLIFVLEDDAQDGPDHVDSHRSTGYLAGPYVKQGVTVSTRYSTVNMIRTIEDVLGLQHLNLHDAGVKPMTDVFDLARSSWTYKATPSIYLYGTGLAPLLPAPSAALAVPTPTHTAAWWARETLGMDFSREDRIDANAFNHILWRGLMGDRPYPAAKGKVSAVQ